MKSCSSALCVLILLVTTFTTGCESIVPPVKVELHGSATLSCSERCSGLVRWTVSSKPKDTLAECDQTSCRSVKEGYQMIHHQYLNGDLSLTITDADFSKRGWYTCDCDDKDLCDVQLLTEPLKTSLQIKTSESLLLDLDVSDPVEVIYNPTDPAGPSSGQICTVDGRSLQCRAEYTQRVLVASMFELRGVTPSDSGVYTVMDVRSKEVVRTYTVTVQDDRSDLDTETGAAVPVWGIILGVVVMVLVAGIGVSVVVIVRLRKENQRLQQEKGENRAETNHHCNCSPGVERQSLHCNL